MTTCFIKWDNSYSYKLANPDNNFSIINVQGIPQKIIWDGGGSGKEHIINNPNNYSYSLIGSTSFTNTTHSVKAAVTFNAPSGYQIIDLDSSGTNINLAPQLGFKNIPFLGAWEGFYPQMSQYSTTFVIYYQSYKAYKLDEYCKNYPNFWPKTSVTFRFDDSYNDNTGNISIKWTLQKTNPDTIKIIDNNTTYIYSITNTNSVEIIYTQGGKKIQIEGNQYDIIDANSAYKDCDKHCPNGLIECQCGNQLCCYKKTNSGYQLVSTIKL